MTTVFFALGALWLLAQPAVWKTIIFLTAVSLLFSIL